MITNDIITRRVMMNDKLQDKDGTQITCEDCKGSKFSGLTLYGRSTQKTTTGAQLLDYDNLMPDTAYGINGALQSNKGYVSSQLINVTSNSPYTISGLGKVAVIILQYSSEKVLLSRKTSNTNGTYTTLEDVCYIGLTFYAEVTVDMLKNVMLNSGSTPLTWEPYTGGKPSPSPDYPQEIESVGQDGEIGVEVLGKNLITGQKFYGKYSFDKAFIKDFNADVVLPYKPQTAVDGICYVINAIAGKTYTFSGYNLNPNATLRIAEYANLNDASDYRNAIDYKYSTDINTFVTYTAKENGVIICLIAGKWTTSGNLIHDCTESELFQTELGTVATPYEPYHEPQFASIATPNGLPGIQVASGGNYTDTDGRQWICDEVDFARGMYVQNIKVSKSLNKLRWSTWGVNKMTNGITGFYTYDIDTPKINEAVSNIASYNDDIYGGKKVGIKLSIITPTSSTPYMVVCVRNDTISDISSDNAAIQSFKEMLAETDAYMMYVLATPIETPLTSDQLAAYKQLHTYADSTAIISNDANAYMGVTYRRMRD